MTFIIIDLGSILILYSEIKLKIKIKNSIYIYIYFKWSVKEERSLLISLNNIEVGWTWFDKANI